jgi:hypothetical protein
MSCSRSFRALLSVTFFSFLKTSEYPTHVSFPELGEWTVTHIKKFTSDSFREEEYILSFCLFFLLSITAKRSIENFLAILSDNIEEHSKIRKLQAFKTDIISYESNYVFLTLVTDDIIKIFIFYIEKLFSNV